MYHSILKSYYKIKKSRQLLFWEVLLGQSIGVIDSLKNVKAIMDEIVEDAEKRLKNAYSLIN